MQSILSRGNKNRLDSAFSLLPTLVILLSLSILCCSILAVEKNIFLSVEKRKLALDSDIESSNQKIEESFSNATN